MKAYCSLHCGHFFGVSENAFKEQEKYLKDLFNHVDFDAPSRSLDVTGARNVNHDPDVLIQIFNTLSNLLEEHGKGRLMLVCDDTEVCFFRRGKWKLMAIQMPEDPFDGVVYAD